MTHNYDHYHTDINRLISFLERYTDNQKLLDQAQEKLDTLAKRYQEDEALGDERYKLYQAQAMLSYRLGEYDKARDFITEAVNIRGINYALATEMLEQLNIQYAIQNPQECKEFIESKVNDWKAQYPDEYAEIEGDPFTRILTLLFVGIPLNAIIIAASLWLWDRIITPETYSWSYQDTVGVIAFTIFNVARSYVSG